MPTTVFFPPLSPSLSPLAMYEPQYYSTYETYKPKSHSIVPSSLAFSRVSNGARFFGTKYTTEDKCWLEFWRLWTIDKGELIINHRLIVIFACLVWTGNCPVCSLGTHPCPPVRSFVCVYCVEGAMEADAIAYVSRGPASLIMPPLGQGQNPFSFTLFWLLSRWLAHFLHFYYQKRVQD